MMKPVLFIAHKPLFPITGGDQVRMVQLLEFVASKRNVDLVYTVHHEGWRHASPHIRGIISETPVIVPFFVRLRQLLRSLFNNRPSAVNHFFNKRMKRLLDANAPKYDMVVCASTSTAEYVLDWTDKQRYLDMTDSLSMNYRRAADNHNGLRRWIYRIDSKRMRAYEHECLRKFMRTALISEQDMAYIAGKSGEFVRKMTLVHNAVDIPQKKSGCDGNIISFIGRMDYQPNVVAVGFFVKRVMPLLRRMIPGIRFRIAGAAPVAEVRALACDDVEVTGFVDCLDDIYLGSVMMVAPMLGGSGLQNKILQAMAYGCCVVTTPHGAEGMENGRNALVITPPDPETMALEIKKYFNDRNLRLSKGEMARAYIADVYSHASVDAQLNAFIENI